MDILSIVIIMEILALAVMGLLMAAISRLEKNIAALTSLTQWAILNRPPPPLATPSDTPYPGLGAAMPGEVKFHFPSILFPERPDGTSTLT